MEFKFTLSQRVVVPRTQGKVQGVVSARKEFVGLIENEYDVHWLNEDLTLTHDTFAESELQRAQPGFVTPLKWERVPLPGETVNLVVGGGVGGAGGSVAKPKRKRPAKKRSRKKSKSKR